MPYWNKENNKIFDIIIKKEIIIINIIYKLND